MNQSLIDFGQMSREQQKGVFICCFRGLGKIWTGAEYAKEIMLVYPKLFRELMDEINTEWEAALKSRRDEKETSN